MTIWYKATARAGEIVPVDVERETEFFVFINKHREAKNSDYRWFRKTREEAKTVMLEWY